MSRPAQTIPSSDAVEQLRERVKAARLTAGGALRGLPLDDLAKRVEGHAAGTNCNGWVNPYDAKTDARAALLEYQFAWREDSSRFKIGLMARQSGKDFSSESEAAEDCLARKGTEWMIAAPSERQALDSLDQGKTWAAAFDLKIADYQERREGDSETLLKSAEIIFSNGSRMRAVPGKPDTVRGRSANLLMTEFDFFENPAATWRAVYPSITNPLRGGEKRIRLVSTPNGVGGAMQRIWEKEDNKVKWSRHLVTIYHAVLMGLPVDIAEIREAFDDPDGFAQEYLCQFLDTSNVLLPYDILQMAETPDASEVWELDDQAGAVHPLYCGIDFGRSNDPTVCWTLQRVGDVLWTREILELRNISSPEQEAILTSRIRRAQRTCFDYTGPGMGLGDYLVRPDKGLGRYKPDEHLFGKIELCVFTAKFKRELFSALRTAFKDPKGVCHLRTPISIRWREDLHEMQQVLTGGEYNYWSRRTREGHADGCTALGLGLRAAGTIGAGCITAETIKQIRIGGSRSLGLARPRYHPMRLA